MRQLEVMGRLYFIGLGPLSLAVLWENASDALSLAAIFFAVAVALAGTWLLIIVSRIDGGSDSPAARLRTGFCVGVVGVAWVGLFFLQASQAGTVRGALLLGLASAAVALLALASGLAVIRRRLFVPVGIGLCFAALVAALLGSQNLGPHQSFEWLTIALVLVGGTAWMLISSAWSWLAARYEF